MSEISKWLISILSVVISGVLVDLLLPNGKLNGFIRAIFGFLAVTIIISPLPSIINRELSFENVIYNYGATQIDQDFVDASIKNIITNLENATEQELKNEGFENVNVVISYIIENYKYTIKKVSLDIKNLVINSNQVHINKYTEMKQIVVNFLNVSTEEVEINE